MSSIVYNNVDCSLCSVYGGEIGMMGGGLGGRLHVAGLGHELFYLGLDVLDVLLLHAGDLQKFLSFLLTPRRICGHRIFTLKERGERKSVIKSGKFVYLEFVASIEKVV